MRKREWLKAWGYYVVMIKGEAIENSLDKSADVGDFIYISTTMREVLCRATQSL